LFVDHVGDFARCDSGKEISLESLLEHFNSPFDLVEENSGRFCVCGGDDVPTLWTSGLTTCPMGTTPFFCCQEISVLPPSVHLDI
jgi:hypothetical protein